MGRRLEYEVKTTDSFDDIKEEVCHMRYPNGTARYDILSRFHTGTHNIRLTKQCPLR